MAKASQTLIALKKLYDKRAVLDKQIVTAEKKLITEAEKASKTVSDKPAKKLTGKKPGRKPRAKPAPAK